MRLKKGLKTSDILKLHKNAHKLLSFCFWYEQEFDVEVVITSLISDREKVKGATQVHPEGRGVDVRTRNWTTFHKYNFCNLANERLKDIAAISNETKQPLAAKLEKDHIHMQCKR